MEGEIAFSKILYEDSKYLFVYEGRPDMVVWLNSDQKDKMIVDHKSQARRNDIYPYNNQVLGYCWGLGVDTFCYNYFGLQETGDPKDWFRRSAHRFSKSDIENWKSATIEWFKKIADDTQHIKSLQCSGTYGICTFKDLCECREDWARADKIRREYKQKEFKVWQ